MTASDKKMPAAVGFLTMVEDSENGVFGGYLVLNALGRPLEFHCTAPVKANRAQEILYGATLAPYLYGEQIGQTLINKGKVTPLWVCTDKAAALAAREFVSMPVALAMAEGQAEIRLDGAHTGASAPHARGLSLFTVGSYRLATPSSRAEDRHKIESRWPELAENFDLLEPFLRIREALAEAQKGR